MIRRLRTLAAVVLVLVVGRACIDTTPIHVDENSKDASVIPGPDSDVVSACRECVTGDGAPCRADYDFCKSQQDCAGFFDCAVDLGCFSFPLLQDRLACGRPCLDAIGFTSVHPGLPGIVRMNECSQAACRSACLVE